MQESLQWSSEQKKRAHSRIFEDLMRRFKLTEAQIISRLDDNGPKAQSTVSRWKTLDVRPNRHIYLDLLKNIFQLSYEQIDGMLWLSGMPSLLRQEVAEILGNSQIFYEKTENELGLAAYKLLIDTIGTDLGLSAPRWEIKQGSANDKDEFTFTVKSPGKKFMISADEVPIRLEGRFWPPYVRSLVWVVLQDTHSNYYLQSPPLKFMPDGRWVADNIVPGQGITTLHFVALGAEGNSVFMRKVRRREWGAFSEIPKDGKIIKTLPISLKIS